MITVNVWWNCKGFYFQVRSKVDLFWKRTFDNPIDQTINAGVCGEEPERTSSIESECCKKRVSSSRANILFESFKAYFKWWGRFHKSNNSSQRILAQGAGSRQRGWRWQSSQRKSGVIQSFYGISVTWSDSHIRPIFGQPFILRKVN